MDKPRGRDHVPTMSDEDFGREESRFGGRIRRYAKVGTSVGGLAAQVVGSRYLGLNLDRGQHSNELKQALGGLKGPLMKAALAEEIQILWPPRLRGRITGAGA